MKKLFVSQPMNGRTDEEILAERLAAVETVKEILKTDGVDEEVELIDSFFQSAPHDASPVWFLGKSIQLLASADIVYFCTGWQDARGCRIEHACAEEYEMDYIEYVPDEYDEEYDEE